MALVTVQRSPSPSGSDESDEHEVCDGTEESNIKSPRQRRRRRSKSALKKLRKLFNTVRFVTKLKPCFSESYFTVKGAALILPQSDYETAFARKVTKSHGGDIQSHLQAMFSLLRPQDTIKVAVRLESSHTKYLAVVSCVGKQDTEESVILGIDITADKAAIGLVIPVWAHAHIQLDGDGGFSIQLDNDKHVFKPVSVQAMWSALQSLNKVLKVSREKLYIPRGLTHTWTGFYESKLDTISPHFGEWNTSEDIDRSYRHSDNSYEENDDDSLHRRIKTELKLVMMKVDLEEVTCLHLRKEVEKVLGVDLKEHRSFFDKEMFAIMGQMDAPSMILEHLYLGSEWNASNLEELQSNGVNYILNISREIDNFFPGILHYMNVREWDVEGSNLLKYWEDTFKFIDKARNNGSKTLVHCKMGISRSASTVIAYLMKENKWSLQQAFEFTKGKRSIINPNAGFWKQLETYEGILNASGHRPKFEKKNSEGLLTSHKEEEEEEEENMEGLSYLNPEDFLALKLGPEASGLGELAFIPEPDTRSADSTEESYPDKQSPNMMRPGRHHRHHHYHKKRQQLSPTLAADKEKTESGDYLSTDDSECTDSENITDSSDDEGGNSEEKGKKFKPIDIPLLNIAEPGSPGRVKKSKKRQVERSKSDGDKHLLNVDSVNPSFSRESSLSRYRPDGSWIKLEPEESDKSEGEIGNLKESDADSSADRLDDKKAEDIGLWINNLVDGEPEDMEVSNDALDVKKENDPELVHKKEDACTDVASVVDEDKGGEDKGEDKTVNVLDPYVKENIPWNPGTVRKQKQDLEEKYASSQGGSKKQDSVEGGESSKQDSLQDAGKKTGSIETSDSLQQDGAKTVEEAEKEVNGEDTPCSPSALSINPTVPIDGGEKKELTSCDSPNLSEEVQNTSDTKILSSDEKILSMETEGGVDPVLRTNRRSVYEQEEIDLPEGIVKKTTMEIEERNKSTEEAPTIKVQRSSSLKSKRVTPKAKDRDNERRKTCIALLSPTHADYTQRESSQHDKEDDSASSSSHSTGSDQGKADADEVAMECQASSDKEEENMTASVKVYKYMGEELTVQEGLVRKQTMEYKAQYALRKVSK